MKFLVDVNASGSVVQWLQMKGYDVALVTDRDRCMRDEDILSWAVSEQRIVVTTDLDFEEMIWREGRIHCGLLRLENLPRAERIALLKDTIMYHEKDLYSGAIVIAMSRKIRVRKR